jgi:hypothetical protein
MASSLSNEFLDQNKPLATLSLQGWVRDIGKQIDMAIAYCFVSNASQSYIFEDRVLSVQKLIHDYTGDIGGLCTNLQLQLESYLKLLFDDATVEVTSDAAKATGSTVALFVHAVVTVNGKQYNTAAGVDVKDSRIMRFFDLNNSGPSY